MRIGEVFVRARSDLDRIADGELIAFFAGVAGEEPKSRTGKPLRDAMWRLLEHVRNRREREEQEEIARRQPVAPRDDVSPGPERGRRPPGKGLSFRLPPLARCRSPKPSSARGVAFALLSRPEGALFSEIMEKCSWTRAKAYEGVRLLSVYCGHGLWSEQVSEEPEDYRIRVISEAEFLRLKEIESA